jgi:hypothetical protein
MRLYARRRENARFHISSQVHSTGLCHLSVMPGGYFPASGTALLTAGGDRRRGPMSAATDAMKRSVTELLCHFQQIYSALLSLLARP